MVAVMACAMYAYYVNSRRPDGDPKKKNYHPLAFVFAPITFPIFAVLFVSFFILRALSYGVFMVVFILALIFIRKPFILVWLQKIATGIGDRLLEANTLLVKFFLRPRADPQKSA
jgi:hypothetical protein